MIGFTYPILSIFWSMLMFAATILMLFLIIWCFIDNFRRTDHHGGAKLGWTLLIIFIPVLGALIYIVARPAKLNFQ